MVAPVDIEAAMVAYLEPLLGVPVRTRVPNPRPDAHVRVTRIGGNARNLVASDPRVLVECWAPSEPEAFDLAKEAYTHLAATRQLGLNGIGVYRALVDEPVNFEDPDADYRSRYQFTTSFLVNIVQERN